MKLLIGGVNSNFSLLGLDLQTDTPFWILPKGKLSTCGLTYFGDALLTASMNSVHFFGLQGNFQIGLTGPFQSLLHSIHPLDAQTFGVVDTGNSAIRLFTTEGEQKGMIQPLQPWPSIIEDAIHLNDFVKTPHGVLASCFDFRPWRHSRSHFEDFQQWCAAGFGLILNTSVQANTNVSRIVGCGFNHPHTLQYHHPYLYLCSSATGEFHRCVFEDDGTIRKEKTFKITDRHFIRGACKVGNVWYLGGSTSRHGHVLSKQVAVYVLNESTGNTRRIDLPFGGEIYDILPWREEILGPTFLERFGGTGKTPMASPQYTQAGTVLEKA